MAEDCGCQVRREYVGGVIIGDDEIVRCPLHAAAPSLAEAARPLAVSRQAQMSFADNDLVTVRMNTGERLLEFRFEVLRNLLRALAAAEGRDA